MSNHSLKRSAFVLLSSLMLSLNLTGCQTAQSNLQNVMTRTSPATEADAEPHKDTEIDETADLSDISEAEESAEVEVADKTVETGNNAQTSETESEQEDSAADTAETPVITDTTPPVIEAMDIKVPYGIKLNLSEIASITDDQDTSPTLEVTSVELITDDEAGGAANTSEASTEAETAPAAPAEEATNSETSSTASTAEEYAPTIEPEDDSASDSSTSSTATAAETASTSEVEVDDTPDLLFENPGLYNVTLTGTDMSGNQSQKSIVVTVKDKIAPVISGLKESFTLTDKDKKAPNYLNGITAADEIDGDLTASISIDDSKVKYGVAGTYAVTYSVSDASGNKATATTPVTINDTTPPVITLSHSSLSKTVVDSKPNYTYYVSKAEDTTDGNVKSSLSVDDSKVKYKKPGTYKVTISAQDKSGNVGKATMQLTITAGWITRSRKLYYYSPEDGHLYHGWSNIDGKKYYFDPDTGVLVTGLQTIDGKQYLLNKSDGHMETGWQKIDGKEYYFALNDGHMYHDWSNIDGKKYYFDPSDGHMITGLIYLDGYTYFLNKKDGHMMTGWQTIDDKKYYFALNDGHMYHSWSNIDGKKYYFENNKGYLLTGLCSINGKQYLLDESDGHLITGWQTINGKQYYFSPDDGHMYHDWSTINGKEYYFDPTDGYMYTGTKYIDGDQYDFGTDGVAEKVVTRQSTTESKSTSDYAYIGNRNSKVFHRSGCASVRKMKDHNKVGFDSRSDAINSGYRPCKNCNP